MTITLCILGWIAGAILTAWLCRFREAVRLGVDLRRVLPSHPSERLACLFTWPVILIEKLFP